MSTFWNKVYNVYRIYDLTREGIKYCRGVVDCRNNDDKLIILLEGEVCQLEEQKAKSMVLRGGIIDKNRSFLARRDKRISELQAEIIQLKRKVDVVLEM
jgi:hypothetical protein